MSKQGQNRVWWVYGWKSYIRVMVQGFSRIDCMSMESEEGVKWLFTHIISWKIIIYVAWLYIYVAYNLTNLALIPTKSCHAPHPKIQNMGIWWWPTDTHDKYNLFHEYLKLSIMRRITHIYAYTTKKHMHEILNHKQYYPPYLNTTRQEKKLKSSEKG